MSIEQTYSALQKELVQVCEQVGRDPEKVAIMAVSKTVGCEAVASAIKAGFCLFGENRVEGLKEKRHAFPEQTWHFIGNVQSRKISQIVAHADLIHSVYKPSHLSVIDSQAAQLSKVQEILAEVNVSGEVSKGGLTPEEVPAFIEAAQKFDHITVKGFMTMAPQGDKVLARTCFERLALLRDEMQSRAEQCSLDELSMGMSQDWQEAVASGATIIRIGRMIFDSEYAD